MANPVRAGARRVPPVLSVTFATVCAAVPAMAQQAPPPAAGGLSLDVEVIAKQLDIARQQIEPRLGATVYDFTRPAIETQPQGDNQPLNQLLLQAPGVAQDSFGQVHVRGDHANSPKAKGEHAGVCRVFECHSRHRSELGEKSAATFRRGTTSSTDC